MILGEDSKNPTVKIKVKETVTKGERARKLNTKFVKTLNKHLEIKRKKRES